MSSNTPTTTLILYRIHNSKADTNTNKNNNHYNAQYIHTNSPVLTLRAIQNQLHDVITALSPTGFHWRVRMEDPHRRSYSWWDVQDENAKLPVRDMSYAELESLLHRSNNQFNSSSSSGTHKTAPTLSAADAAASSAKSALKGLTKAINSATTNSSNSNGNSNSKNPFSQVPVRVVVLKLLDLARLGEHCTYKVHVNVRSNDAEPRRVHTTPASQQKVQGKQHVHPTNPSIQYQQQHGRRTTATRPQPKQQVRRAAPVQEANLMDFGSTPPSSARKQPTPSSFANTKQPLTETRAEKLKREYAQNAAKQNRVWDDVDQRWVDVGSNNDTASSNGRAATSSNGAVRGAASTSSAATASAKVKGISLDNMNNAAGKSAAVQAAVHARVSEMKKAQNAALQELRQRERKAKMEEDAEDVVRRRLEPRIKAWSEEHGKKKQLCALLASLHIILWPEAKWKQVSIGDILDDKKARRCYLKATLKVHPDKTKDLDPEKKFIAKRVFDALSQAFTQFEGKQ